MLHVKGSVKRCDGQLLLLVLPLPIALLILTYSDLLLIMCNIMHVFNHMFIFADCSEI